MKKKTGGKPSKLTAFEKRVEERHKRQEAEYGRDEFLFGMAEDDEEADVEFDATSELPEISETVETHETPGSAPDADAVDPDISGQSVRIGEHTEMIANEVIEAEMAQLASEMAETLSSETEPEDAVTGSVPEVSVADEMSADSAPEAEVSDSASVSDEYDVDDDDDFFTKEVAVSGTAKADVPQNTAQIGEHTEMIVSEMIEEELAQVASQVADDAEDKEMVASSAEAESAGEVDEAEYSEPDDDFDFYETPKKAERKPKSQQAVRKNVRKASGTAKTVKKAEPRKTAKKKESPKTVKKSSKTDERISSRKASKAPDRKPSSKPATRKSSKKSSKRKPGFFGGIIDFFSNMTMGDRLIVVTGVCVLAIAIFAGTVFVNAQNIKRQVASFADVGTSTDDIYIVGEDGINAVVSARANYMPVVEDDYEEEEPEQEMVQEDNKIKIVLKVSSVQSDLKIKFANAATDKLIKDIAFSVVVKSDSGKEYNWTDENMDGLMYHTEVPNGTYSVHMVPLEGEQYKDYIMPGDVNGVKVTDTIQYKKIDVADEVKKESEVNVAQEDTAVQDTAVESVLTDTVEWVESTKTLISGSETGFTEINKNDIDPNKTSRLNTRDTRLPLVAKSYRYDLPIMLTSKDGIGKNGTGSVDVNDSITIEVTGISDSDSVSWSPGDSSIASLTENGKKATVIGVSAGTYSVDATVSFTDDDGNPDTTTLSWSITVNEPASQVLVDRVSISGASSPLKIGQTCGLSATVYNNDNSTDNGGVDWTSSDSGVASVDSSGVVTANKAGSATITATSKTNSSKSDSCSITVEEEKVAISFTLKPSSVSLKVGDTAKVEVSDLKGTSDSGASWDTADHSIATVDGSGNVRGIKVGETTLTATLNADGNTKQSIKISVLSATDPNAPLMYNGKQVYYRDSNGEYKKAKISDYDKYSQFFIEGGAGDAVYKYTGWQTIDGATYYFTKDGAYVTGEQIIQGAKYNFGSDGHLQAGNGTMGIDVSKWNGNIDWTAVRNSGVSYVIIRCGYRGSTTGALIEDPMFRKNIQGAKAAGLSVGAYFFTQAVNEVEAVEEASMAVGLCSGYGLSLPIFLDVEHSGGRGDSIDAGTRTAVCKAFCQTVRNSGYGAGVYANKVWFTSYINASQLTGYKIWLAQYAATPTYTATRYDYWQYSSKGQVAGINGYVDMNLRY